ncbi:MAG: hypothetical protein ACK4NY_02185 [Spirosomataceae bacterium]
MPQVSVENNLKRTYLALLNRLSVDNRLEIIAELSLSLKNSIRKPKKADFYSGVWQSEDSAEDIIASIRSSRTFNRRIEEF